MGSGERIKFFRTDGFGVAIFLSRFPFDLTIAISVMFWTLSIGIGRAYDAPETER
jgi:hypothetical protein